MLGAACPTWTLSALAPPSSATTSVPIESCADRDYQSSAHQVRMDTALNEHLRANRSGTVLTQKFIIRRLAGKLSRQRTMRPRCTQVEPVAGNPALPSLQPKHSCERCASAATTQVPKAPVRRQRGPCGATGPFFMRGSEILRLVWTACWSDALCRLYSRLLGYSFGWYSGVVVSYVLRYVSTSRRYGREASGEISGSITESPPPYKNLCAPPDPPARTQVSDKATAACLRAPNGLGKLGKTIVIWGYIGPTCTSGPSSYVRGLTSP